MEGRVQVRCAECGKTRECSGEIPREYINCFKRLVEENGFVPRPGVAPACLAANYSGSESVDDAP